MIREDIRLRKAIDLVAEAATPIPAEQAEAREKLWTPEKEREAAGSSGPRATDAAPWPPEGPAGPPDAFDRVPAR